VIVGSDCVFWLGRPAKFCGAPATHMRQPRTGELPVGVYCAQHRRLTDVFIPKDVPRAPRSEDRKGRFQDDGD